MARSQGLKKEKEGTFKNLGLVAVQCNGIAACAYSLKTFTVHTLVRSSSTFWVIASADSTFFDITQKGAFLSIIVGIVLYLDIVVLPRGS